MTTKQQPIEPIRQLQALGFTEYEARAYVTLLQQGELSGYAWARESGIPRANIYAVAEKLVERGAVQRVQVRKGVAWAPVPVDTLLGGIHEQHRHAMGKARQSLAELGRAQEPRVVVNLRDDEMMVQAHQLIESARQTLLVAIQPAEASRLAEPLRAARERGVAITTLCLEACEQPCGGCQGDLHRFQMCPCDGSRWLVLSVDDEQALLGQFQGPATAEGLVTGQRLVVELATAYIRQSLALATLDNELAGRFDGLLSERARQLLGRLFPEGLLQIPRETE